jgi:hypothetical protein
MRRILLASLFASAGLAGGCVPFNQYSGDPNIRTNQLLNQSEDLRQLRNEWRRIWHNDMPSHMTPEHVHGGIVP